MFFLDLLTPFFEGARNTLLIFIITLIGSIPLGWILSLLRMSKNKLVSGIIGFYCWVMRGTPLMLQLTFVYYGLPLISRAFTLQAHSAVYLVFALNYAAYFAEIFRGGIESIDKGQYEAAEVLGLTSSQTMTRIILPQALKTVMPSMGNEVITLVKDTSLAYTITMVDILRVAQIIAVRDFTISAYIGVAVFYLVFTWMLTILLEKIEQRLSYYE